MQICLHRGSCQIGGSCLELKSAGSRILFDYGLPLNDLDETTSRSRMHNPAQHQLALSGLHESDYPQFEGILLSHAHPDHHGLLGYVHSEIPVFANAETQTLLAIGAYFQPEAKPIRNLRTIAAGEPFAVGAFRVTPYLMDHSAYGALAFLVEAAGKRVFYSGDFRGHGRKGSVLRQFVAEPPAPVDVLILEGTVIGRAETGLPSEAAVQHELERQFHQHHGLTFIAFSSQNVDRVVSIYKACRRSGKIFVIDPYTAYVLHKLGGRLPQFDYQDVRIYFAPGAHTKRLAEHGDLFFFKNAKISFQELLENRDRVVIKNTYAIREKFARTGNLSGAGLVYSQWWGYFENEREFWTTHGIEPIPVHTSGHALVSDLQALAQALRPRIILPVHTRHPEAYPALFGEKALVLPDGQSLEI
jgi:ribonuclease J